MELKHINKKQNKLLYRAVPPRDRKITAFITTVHSVSSHPMKQRLPFCRFMLQRKYEFPLRQKAKDRVICRYTAKLKRFTRNTITKLKKKVKKIRKAYTPNWNENNTERKFRVFITAYVPKFRKYVKNTNLRLHIDRTILFIGICSKKYISTVKTNSVHF
jgi:hypothetical protein